MEALLLLLLIQPQKPVQETVQKIDNTERNCLAANIYYEARGESIKGQKAVAQVTLNRVRSKKYPKTICSVVLQKKQFSWTEQVPKQKITLALNGAAPSKKPLELAAYQQAQQVATNVLKSPSKPVFSEQVLWYHTVQVNPKWSRQMLKVDQIGTHVFYRHRQEGKI